MQTKGLVRIEKIRLVFFISLLCLLAYALFSLPRLSIPLSISFIIYLIFSPAIPMLEKLGLKKSIATNIVFALFLLFTIYPIFKGAPLITNEARNVQYYIPKVENYVKREYQGLRLQIKQKTGYDFGSKYIDEGIRLSKTGVGNLLLKIPQYLASFVEWIFVVPLFVFFLLKDGTNLRKSLLIVCPNFLFERFYYLTHQFNKKIGNYIFAKVIEASIVGAIILCGLLIMGIKFSVLLALVAMFTNIIPYLGPVLGAVPALILVAVEHGVGPTFFAVFLLYLIANAIDIALVFPILVSKVVDLHPVTVVVSVILGSQYFGILGMVISIPLAAAAKLIITEIYTELYSAKNS